ncbi:hypothetical protein, partial [Citrobacter freundii]|uniref:hypothetical protein n=1 Tax=Citrobacter freundii TaxID=546 RepID=UPI001C6A2B38
GRGRGRGPCGQNHNQNDKNRGFQILFFHGLVDLGDFPSGTGAVMLRTEPAALSLPGPPVNLRAAGFHPRLSQRQRLACSDRSGRAALSRRSCARCTPFRGVRGNVVDVAGSLPPLPLRSFPAECLSGR